MKINELKLNIKTAYLYEGLTPKHKTSMKLWESAGRAIMEANLTVDQITQLFQQIEKGQTELGGNRTLLGLAKDDVTAVMKAYNDLKTKVANSGPVKGIDALYDQAAEKLKQATGGDQGVMQYVQKYRDFAKAHPIAQSIIYGALIAAAGISGAGAGGAAALGLFKMVDKLLQGEKFSSAAYSGAKTGAMAYAAGQIGKAMRGDQAPAGTDQLGAEWAKNQKELAQDLLQNYTPADYNYVSNGLDINIIDKATGQLVRQIDFSTSDAFGTMDPETFIAKTLSGEFGKAATSAASKASRDAAAAAFDAAHPNFESRTYTPEQVQAIFEHIVIAEGLFDKFKTGAAKVAGTVGQGIKNVAGKAVGAVAQKAQQVGHNLTTKVTADKLSKAWKAAGSPTESSEIGKLLVQQGIDINVINGALKSVGVDINSAPTGGKGFGFNSQTGQPYNSREEQQAGEAENENPAVFTPGGNRGAEQTAPAIDVTKFTPQQKQELLKQLDALDAAEAAQQPAQQQPRMAIADPRLNPAMPKAGQSSTGGTVTPTSTGYIHKANPNNPNLKAQTA